MAERHVALVTGANKGLGLEVVRQLSGRGYTVWLGARDEERGRAAVAAMAAEGADVRFVQIDVTDDASVLRAKDEIARATDHLDVVVSSAGVALDRRRPPSEVDVASIRATFEVNVFGAVRVAQAFLPLLRAAGEGRLVMVSSDQGSLTHETDPGYAYYGLNLLGYSSSKAALSAVVVAFAKELAGSNVRVNAVNPGFTATDLNGHRGTQTVAEGAAAIVEAALRTDGAHGRFLKGGGDEEPW